MATDTEVAEEATGEDTTSQEEFTKLVSGVEYSAEQADDPAPEESEPTDEEVEDDEEVSTETDEQEPKEVEGPTAAMKTLAIQMGLPPSLIAMMRDDGQINELIELASQQAEPQEEEEAELPDFEVSLPEEEFPEDDPVRKELSRLQSHFKKQISDLQGRLQKTAKSSREVERQQQELQLQQSRQFQAEFDNALDKLGEKAFGKSGSLSNRNIQARTAVFEAVRELYAADPNAPMSELAKRAAEEIGFSLTNKSPDEKAAIRKQSSKRLGSGSSRPPEPAKQSPEEMMRGFLKTLPTE